MDDINKQQLTTLVLLNRMSDKKVTAAVLKDKSLRESGYKINEVRRKIHNLESQKKKVELFTNNKAKIPSIAIRSSTFRMAPDARPIPGDAANRIPKTKTRPKHK